jgi:hypothetical protein
VLSGFWPDGEEILDDERLRVAVGADYYTSSLRDSVDACLEVAHKASIDEQFQCSPASIVDTVEGLIRPWICRCQYDTRRSRRGSKDTLDGNHQIKS